MSSLCLDVIIWPISIIYYIISLLPLPYAKFQESKSDYLGQLIVTPQMVAKKIMAMMDNKSPGVFAPKLLTETVEQISIPLARVFSLSLREGVVPVEWKDANIIPLLKKGSRNKSENYRAVNLTSVICKLQERIIKHQRLWTSLLGINY